MKKDGLFDVIMGAYDGTELCELVVKFLLDKISEKHDRRYIGLHREDGLSAFKNKSDTQLERIKKSLHEIFKDFDLEIVAESNVRIVNYFTTAPLNLTKKEWNHPPNVIKQLPACIAKRFSNHSSDGKIFKESANLLRRSFK